MDAFTGQSHLPTAMNIGQRIKDVVTERGLTVTAVAQMVPCKRSNMYSIFHRKDIGLQLLMRLSVVLNHDFLADLSAEFQRDQCADLLD